MIKKYSITYSNFFYIYANHVDFVDSRWQKIFCDEKNMLCFDKLKNYAIKPLKKCSIIVGQRHENGDGLYCQVTIDNSKEEVSFESDVAGGVPVFWYAKADMIIVASSIGLLISLAKDLEIELKPNLNALSGLLIASYIFSDMQTGVQDVNLLPPKSKLIINSKNGKINVERTAPDFEYDIDTLTWEHAKQKFKEGLIDGLQRHQNKKVACLLSGGADSRIVAASAAKSGIDIDFFTFGQSTVNISDFFIANHIGHRLGKKVNCFPTSANDFLLNWKQTCSNANWINDSVWWAGRIPEEMFRELEKYDVIIRGDGDGIYGWKTAVANVSDILHRLEISEICAVKQYFKYFTEPESVFSYAEESRNELVAMYENKTVRLRDLTNILYQKIREPRGIAPGIWYFSRLTAVDAPLLWKQPLAVAARIPRNKRYNKQIIFEVLETFNETRDVHFSTGGSWDNQLEFYYTGVWEELLSYIKKYSPFPVNYDNLHRDYVKPSRISRDSRSYVRIYSDIKRTVLSNKYGRKIAFKYFPYLANTSMSERLIIRLALISNLCELITTKRCNTIVSYRK